MVEAGGVEPPSEKARREETTCVAGSLSSATASEPARAEAGGVEPPSEKARTGENYVRIRVIISTAASEPARGGHGLARLDLSRRLRTEAFGLSRKMTLTHRRAGSAAGAAT